MLADNARCGFCDGCFTGKYPMEPPQDTAKLKFERRLSEKKNEQTEEQAQ